MNSLSDNHHKPRTRFQTLERACQILREEANAVTGLADRLNMDFCEAIDLVLNVAGNVIVTGIGKAGLIGQKLTATLASTGTRSHFVHPAEAAHGDLGRIHPHDVVIALSHSGETDEIVRMLSFLGDNKIPTIAITGNPGSSLAKRATVVLDLGNFPEADALGLAPSTSTTVMLAFSDAFALVLSELRGFRAQDFARLHPAGALGRKLARVEDVMRSLASCRVAQETQTVRQVLVSMGRPGRRAGAVLLVDQERKLSGIFTDSDLARLLEQGKDELLDRPIGGVMTRTPMVVRRGSRMTEAMDILRRQKISELPVVDDQDYPIGMIDITDVVACYPRPELMEPTVRKIHAADDQNHPARTPPAKTA